MASVFLSYDHDDAERAAPIAAALEKSGHTVWWDRHIKAGAAFNDEIEAAVEEADAVVVLWSERSVRSTWVRDEAAEGRDQGKLVPVLLDAVKPPMGFRQFQTIDCTRSGRRPAAASLQQITDAINAIGSGPQTRSSAPVTKPAARFDWISRRTGVVAVAVALLAVVGLIAWTWRSQPAHAVVAVTASDTTPRTQALSRDLVVTLGSLAHIGGSKWQLADPHSAPSDPDLIFRVAGVDSATQRQASLVLLDGRKDSILWSREFAPDTGSEADLRQQLSLTAGQVLSCVLEAREESGLPDDLFKRYLAACSDAAGASELEPDKLVSAMRAIIAQRPGFAPAWAQLLMAQGSVLAMSEIGGDAAAARKALAQDIGQARQHAPDLPEIRLAEIDLLPPHDYAGALGRLRQAKELAPDMADVWLFESDWLMRVGRMWEAAQSAKRAAKLEPISPALTKNLIMTLAYSGQIEPARKELQNAERRWADTGSLQDAQWGFHLRYGDPKIAMAVLGDNDNSYLRARLAPTAANVDALVTESKRIEGATIDQFSWAIQALGEFNKTEEVFAWLDHAPPSRVAKASYVLFRPALADVRRDPRFMVVAKRIGLTSYWQKSGKWPDYCYDPKLPYDCKKEAAKRAS